MTTHERAGLASNIARRMDEVQRVKRMVARTERVIGRIRRRLIVLQIWLTDRPEKDPDESWY